jgi:putative redox protein
MANKSVVRVSGNSIGMQSVLTAGNHSITIDEPPHMGGQDTGPDPLSAFLGALAGCENVIANMVAKEINFNLEKIELEVKGILDPRGLMGNPEVKPYFEKVTVHVKVHTSESQERINELQAITDQRCPIFTTLKAAGIELEGHWTKA